jgi:hypothetical protein
MVVLPFLGEVSIIYYLSAITKLTQETESKEAEKERIAKEKHLAAKAIAEKKAVQLEQCKEIN